MQTLLESNQIELLKDSNPVYILHGNGRFYDTEHKIMKNMPELIHCYRGVLNDETQLVYITDNYTPLSALLPTLDNSSLSNLMSKLTKAMKSIDSNGFLNWQHVDLNAERIFIQPDIGSINLIYLPIEGYHIPQASLDKTLTAFVSSLSSRTSNKVTILKDAPPEIPVVKPKKIVLYDEEHDFSLTIDKPRFLIGKKASSVDGVIDYSQFVGRIHCQVINQNGNFYIYDLDSTNGTYLNNKEVSSSRGSLLKNNDRLEIADVIFKVIFEE